MKSYDETGLLLNDCFMHTISAGPTGVIYEVKVAAISYKAVISHFLSKLYTFHDMICFYIIIISDKWRINNSLMKSMRRYKRWNCYFGCLKSTALFTEGGIGSDLANLRSLLLLFHLKPPPHPQVQMLSTRLQHLASTNMCHTVTFEINTHLLEKTLLSLKLLED